MKAGDRVQTPDGPGTITGKENTKSDRSIRFGVKLDVNKYDYPIAYYWPHEVKLCR